MKEIFYGGGGTLLWGLSKFARVYYFRNSEMFKSFNSIVTHKIKTKDFVSKNQSSGSIDMSEQVKVFKYLNKYIPATLGILSILGSVIEYKEGNSEVATGLLLFGLSHIAEVSLYLLKITRNR